MRVYNAWDCWVVLGGLRLTGVAVPQLSHSEHVGDIPPTAAATPFPLANIPTCCFRVRFARAVWLVWNEFVDDVVVSRGSVVGSPSRVRVQAVDARFNP